MASQMDQETVSVDCPFPPGCGVLKSWILSVDRLPIEYIIEPCYPLQNFSSLLCSTNFSFRLLSIMSRSFVPCKLAYQVHSSLHFIKNSVHHIRSLSTGETRGNPACACCFIAIFIDTYILKTILEKKGPLSVSERWKECHHIWNPQSKSFKS